MFTNSLWHTCNMEHRHMSTCICECTDMHTNMHSAEETLKFLLIWHFFNYNSITNLSSMGLYTEFYSNFLKPPAAPNHFLEKRF